MRWVRKWRACLTGIGGDLGLALLSAAWVVLERALAAAGAPGGGQTGPFELAF